MSLEDELTRLLEAKVPTPRDRQLVRRVLGWDGQGGCSLKQAGDEVGITRERSRQIYQSAVELLQTCELSSALDDVLAFVNLTCNRDADDVQTELQRRGFTRCRFGARALVQTARIFGRAPDFTIEETGGKLFVVAGPGVVRSILKAALRSSTRYGIQTVSEVCTAIPLDCRRACDRILVRQILKTRNDTRWLDTREQWFWLASVPRNPVVACLKKLLHYASSVSIVDIHRAIGRLPRKRKTPIKREAVVGFCRQAPFCRLRNESVELVASFGAVKALSSAEATVCRILKRNGNELRVDRLQELCASAGITKPNLWRIILYSPLVFRRASGIYRLVTASPGRAETVKRRTA
jgi:hypothetical protein